MSASISREENFSTPIGLEREATLAPLLTTYRNHPAWFEIDLNQFKRNLSLIRRRIGKRRFCCIVKANAYGHGLIEIAKAAQESNEVDLLGVAHLQEGAALRNAGIELPILVLGAIHEEQVEDLIANNLEFTISSRFKAELVAQRAKQLKKRCSVHLEVDTGMRRTGVRSETAISLIEMMASQDCFQLKGVYSHFAMSEEPNNDTTLRQIEEFHQLKNRVNDPKILWHLANSGGVSFYPDSWFDMVRPGLLCYGLSFQNAIEGLEPFLELKAKISYFKVVAKDQGISYGHTYRTEKQTRVVTVPVGYGDGYRRDFSNLMHVLIRGKRYRISGSICMDQFMVDIGQDEAYVGEEVVLLGRQKNGFIGLFEMAKLANTDPREILCHFNERIPRIYSAFKTSINAL